MTPLHNNQRGFSLVETLVAITVLLVVIVGPMTLAANATRTTNFSSEQVIASFLAQEGAELVQKNRDDIILPFFETPGTTDEGWNATGFGGVCGAPSGCALSINDSATGSIINGGSCAGGNQERCRLYRNTDLDSRQRYTHDPGGGVNTPTIYYRNVVYEKPEPDTIRIISRVTWRTDNQRREQSVEVVTYLYNVYGR